MRKTFHRFAAAVLCLCMALSFFDCFGTAVPAYAAEGAGAGSTGATKGVSDRVADGNTMESYEHMLLSDGNSRYAGRLWADKSVIANTKGTGASVTLNESDDGYNESVRTDEDFLHIYSVLGSSQVVNEPAPVDLVLALDISSSMGSPERYEGSYWVNTVDPDAENHTGKDGLGYYQGKDSGGNDTSKAAEDDNGIPDKIVPVLPEIGSYTTETITNGQMSFNFYDYNKYLAACNAIVNALVDADGDKDHTITADETKNLTVENVSEIGPYIEAENRTQENFNKIYQAYLAYKAEFDATKTKYPSENIWLSNSESGRNAIWPSNTWKNGIDGILINYENTNPMLNAEQGPNRMYYVIQAANSFIDRFLSLNEKNRISVVVYDSVATVRVRRKSPICAGRK